MKRSGSKRIVIDASVVRAAGDANAQHPTSKRCRDFLLAVLHVCHRVAITPEIRAEWKQRVSRFAVSWQTQMYARKKVVTLDSREDPALRAKLQHAGTSDRTMQAMLDDCHLLEAAQQVDRIIASLDEEVRELFIEQSAGIRSIRAIVWINPGQQADGGASWLEQGAPTQAALQLMPPDDE